MTDEKQSGAMDPKRLKALKAAAASVDANNDDAHDIILDSIDELIAHADHWEAEAKRYRSRCPVIPSDLVDAGATDEVADRWRHVNAATFESTKSVVSRAIAVNNWARYYSRPAFDILDEMAAIQVGGAL